MADITMPQLGETVTEGTITRWFKKVGDRVDTDETLFEVSTDKVDSEVPSSVGGFLAEILVAEGETVDVGARLAVITEEAPSGVPDDLASPAPARVVAPSPEPDAPLVPPRQVLSPLVRRMLAEHGLDPGAITGTGQGGRITRNDVLARVERGRSRPPAPTPAPAVASVPAPVAPLRVVRGDEAVPFSNIRRRTAEHMVRSQATSAHVLVAIEVDYEGVDRVRLAAREGWRAEEGFSLTYLPFVARAVVDAIRDFPHVNATVGDDELLVHHQVHLGFAVDLSFEGLIVPVVHDADAKRLRTIAREIADLAARARARKLSADEIAGSTFTITNPGSYGTLLTAPVISQPQVAIVSTDGVRKRPVVVELPDGSDAIAVHPVGNLAMSFDHRAFDGAYASAFLARCRDILQARDWSQEL